MDTTNLSTSAAEVRRYDYDRWLVSLFSPPEKRDAIHAVLAFNAEIARIRETVSEPLLGDIRLQWWRDTLQGLKKGEHKAHPVAEALDHTARQQPLDYDLMLDMVDVRARDLDPSPILNDAELLAYADGTGGAVQRLILQVVAGTSPASSVVEAASLAGRAFALLGIIRAIPFHARHDLVLLPTERLQETGMSRYTLLQPEYGPNLQAVVRDLAALADEDYRRVRKERRSLSKEAAPAVAINGLSGLYLKRLKAAGYNPLHHKLNVGAQRKVLTLTLQQLLG
ncbi:phytoene/squalene synthase family protein [Sneathiella chinensis]|uniref:Phytoene synthase n=1 Tax=Sneathiella chinensis TaxID=349750 RepID=A0ABQ5U5P1_9PROT|nr:phytoene/squalene synthase family protein [Sneathiella chinensis]GLQ07459.1 phytoene synthase [Sneathiella chinensis]